MACADDYCPFVTHLQRMLSVFRNHPYRKLEHKIGHRFRTLKWLETALTHRSFRSEHPDSIEDNQRLEFLGDAVLGLLTADFAFQHGNGGDEGRMTVWRSRLASGKALAATARRLELGDWVRLGRGELQSGGQDRDSTLTDALESIVGAVFLDGGWPAAQRCFRQIFADQLQEDEADAMRQNPKGVLQEYAQRHFGAQPQYQVVSETGQAHAPHFKIEVSVTDAYRALGEGANKQAAERMAARRLMKTLASIAEGV